MSRLISTSPASALVIALALASSLAACSTTSTTPKAEASKASTEKVNEENAAAPQIAMGCEAPYANWAIGKSVDDALIAKAKADTSAAIVRVVRPGHAYTMEYNGARLNLNTDKNGLILSVDCG